ncbi:MAG: cbb3-type cytochrome c oxidase subunit 3 [Alphaproteobacteria bacterium]
MELTYEILQVFAKSWGAVGLFIFFVAAVIYALWPSNKKAFKHMAELPMKDDE